MEFTVDRSELLRGLYLAQGIVERRSTIPILNNILIQTVDGGVIVAATDQEVAIRCRGTATVGGMGKLSVLARTLYEILRELPEGLVRVRQQDNNWIEVSSGHSRFRLPGLDPKEFPAMPEPPVGATAQVRISGEMLGEMLERTLFATSTDETRANFNGIHVEVAEEGRLCLVATDGHRLAMIRRVPETAQLTRGVTIPRKAVLELRKIMESDSDDPIELSIEGGLAHASRANADMSMRLVAGEFPDYRQVVPERVARVVSIGAGEWLAALRRVSLVTSDRSRGIRLLVEANRMQMTANSPEMGEAVEELEVGYEGEPIDVGFNVRYLMDVLAVLPAEERVEFGLAGEASPGVIRVSGDQDYAYIVMPMRL